MFSVNLSLVQALERMSSNPPNGPSDHENASSGNSYSRRVNILWLYHQWLYHMHVLNPEVVVQIYPGIIRSKKKKKPQTNADCSRWMHAPCPIKQVLEACSRERVMALIWRCAWSYSACDIMPYGNSITSVGQAFWIKDTLRIQYYVWTLYFSISAGHMDRL